MTGAPASSWQEGNGSRSMRGKKPRRAALSPPQRSAGRGGGERADAQSETEEPLRTAGDKERVGKKEISSVVIKMKNGSPATLNKS